MLLEHEMEKTYAAFAAADAGRALLGPPIEAVMPSNGNRHGDGAPVEVAPQAKAEEPAVTASEPAPEPTVDAVGTQAASSEAAYAAAASAASSDGAAGNAEEGSRVREAELAAAWANWRQIRESIIGDQASAQVADAEAGFKDNQEAAAEPVAPVEAVTQTEPAEEPAHDESQHEAETAVAAAEEAKVDAPDAAAPTEDPAEIASIVDNMLAELKPKLMEELKRKLKK
jgi:hypothetical protein